MTVQPDLCQTCSETTLLVFPRGGSYIVDAGGQNKQQLASKNTAKLDRETEELHHEHVTLDTAKLIQQARQAKGWTQKDLATVSSLIACALKYNNLSSVCMSYQIMAMLSINYYNWIMTISITVLTYH